MNAFSYFDSPSFLKDPYPIFRDFLAKSPIFWDEVQNTWHLFSYTSISACLKDPRFSSARVPAMVSRLSEDTHQKIESLTDTLSRWALFMDPPQHTRIRALLNKSFLPRLVNNMSTRIQALANELIEIKSNQGIFDVISNLAYPLPVIVIGEMLGASLDDRDMLKKWSDDLATFFGVTRMTPEIMFHAQKSIVEMKDYFRGILQDHSRTPREDLMASLISTKEKEDFFTEEDILATCTMLIFGGHETTTNLISNGILALIQNSSQMKKLRKSPLLIKTAVEEFLRYDSPVQRISRMVTEDLEIEGRKIKKGNRVFMILGAANRDPVQFEDPSILDITRTHNPHLAFGAGNHFCIGAVLSRLEGQIAISTFIERFPHIHLANEDLEWHKNFSLRALKALPVVFD
jgi:cytochrome P450